MCAAPKTMERVADRHGALRPPDTKGCESRRRLVRIVPPIYGLWHCFTHTSCICNDTIACVNRVVGEVPLPTPAGIKMVEKAIRRLWPIKSVAALTLEQSLATFKGTKQKLYLRAFESLRVEPLRAKDGKIKAFVKAERFDPAEKENPDPRMIQARDPRYNLHLARFLRPIEHAVYGLKSSTGFPLVLKCKNPEQRAEIFLNKWYTFNDPVTLSLDCTRWDKHVSLEMLNVEHRFYRSFYPNDPELALLLRWQSRNDCCTSNGLKYQVSGGRMSGDMNTALGNVLLMVGMATAAMKALRVRHFELDDDGDDCLVTLERSDLDRVVAALPKIFLEFGQELKIENIAHDFHDVTFCQSKLTWNGVKYTFARNWRKVLSQSCCGTKHWNLPNMVKPMMGLIGDCENALHRGIPILQAFATRLRELSGGLRSQLGHLDSSYQYRIGSFQLGDVLELPPVHITDKARVEFELTWGVDPSTQLAIESAISKWTPGEIFRDVGYEILHPWSQYLDPAICCPTTL